jgi:hypothetical protein
MHFLETNKEALLLEFRRASSLWALNRQHQENSKNYFTVTAAPSVSPFISGL